MHKRLNPHTRFFLLRLFSLILLPVMLLAAGGCAGSRGAVRSGYFKELSRRTKASEVFKGMEDNLYISVTYKDIAFRKAYIEYYAQSYMLDDDLKEVLMKREADEAAKYNEFFFAAFTPEPEWNDFNRRGSVWKIYLEDDLGNRLSPLSIKKVDTSAPVMREFFPYVDLWSYAYTVKFPKYPAEGAEPFPAKDAKYMKFVVTGVLGSGVLKWDLKKMER